METDILNELAEQAMIERGFLTHFSPEIIEAAKIAPSDLPNRPANDARDLLWCSIDNDESKDLDQLTYAEKLSNGHFKIFIAVADVNHLVPQNGLIDAHARYNTTSVYTPTKIFPMLPWRLSTDLTSLNPLVDRLATVIEIEIAPDGQPGHYELYPAIVQSHAKLAYPSVSAWLNGKGPLPPKVSMVNGLEENLKLQDHIAGLLRHYRRESGALTLDTIEAKPIFTNGHLVAIQPAPKDRGRDLIEDFMIAANTATARFLKSRKVPSLRRVVKIPKRWDRIIEIAKENGEFLPSEPDARALDAFLLSQKKKNPLEFPDLSLTIIKLLGSGEYVVEQEGQEPDGHFGLSLKDYTHSTAPNRRYPDLITQRLVQSVFYQGPSPYSLNELVSLAQHCTKREDDAEKVERKLKKSAAILVLSDQLGKNFDAIVTGASQKGTWVRIFAPPVEGKLVKGFQHLEVGDRVRVKLIDLDIQKGFIDFIKS